MQNYYATFEAVPMQVERLASILEEVLTVDGEGPGFSRTVFRLERGPERYEPTHDFAEFECLVDALIGTAAWDAVDLAFSREYREWSVVLWRDEPSFVTVNLCETGAAFDEQLDDEAARVRLVDLLVRMMDALGSRFCVFEWESVFRTRTREDIVAWLRAAPSPESHKYWQLVICDDDFVPSSLVPPELRQAGHFVRRIETADARGRWLVSQMGAVQFPPGFRR